MDRIPESGWVAERRGFVKTEVDPKNGVKTRWRKLLIGSTKSVSRDDYLFDSPLSRHINEMVVFQGIMTRSYAISTIEEGVPKKVKLDTAGKLNMYVETDRKHPWFIVIYKGDNLEKVTVLVSRWEGFSIEDIARPVDFKQDLKTILDFYRGKGEVLDDVSVKAASFETDRIMGNWSEEQKQNAREDAMLKVKSMLKLHLGVQISKEEIDGISNSLLMMVLRSLKPDFIFGDSSLQSKDIDEAFERAVLYTLLEQKEKTEGIADFSVQFVFSAHNGVRVRVQDEESVGEEERDLEEALTGHKIDVKFLHEALINFGEHYKYEEYDFVISKEDGKIALSVSNKMRLSEKFQIIVPERVDLEEFKRRIMIPNNIGWEKALEIANPQLRKATSKKNG